MDAIRQRPSICETSDIGQRTTGVDFCPSACCDGRLGEVVLQCRDAVTFLTKCSDKNAALASGGLVPQIVGWLTSQLCSRSECRQCGLQPQHLSKLLRVRFGPKVTAAMAPIGVSFPRCRKLPSIPQQPLSAAAFAFLDWWASYRSVGAVNAAVARQSPHPLTGE